MSRDVMSRLTAARPPQFDPHTPADPAIRERELTAAFAAPKVTEQGRVRPGGPATPRTRARARWAVRLALPTVAAATAVAVAVTVTPSAGPGRSAPGRAQQMLLTAAKSAMGAPVSSGAYWYTDTVYASPYVIHGKGGPYVVDWIEGDQEWIHARGPTYTPAQRAKMIGKARRTHHALGPSYWDYQVWRDLGARPATPADVAAWRRDGSPTHWTVKLSTEKPGLPGTRALTKAGGQTWPSKNSRWAGDPPFKFGTLRQLQHLPAGTAGLRAFLLRCFIECPGPTAERLLFNAVYLLQDPVSPQVRAAAYRVVAGIHWLHAVGWVTDPLGRRGFAVALPAGLQRPGWTPRFIFDPATGQFLAREDVAGPSGGAGAAGRHAFPPGTMSWIAVKTATWNSNVPRHAPENG